MCALLVFEPTSCEEAAGGSLLLSDVRRGEERRLRRLAHFLLGDTSRFGSLSAVDRLVRMRFVSEALMALVLRFGLPLALPPLPLPLMEIELRQDMIRSVERLLPVS